ncbi:MAG TPA: ATP-binding cassette domain-containing protein [Puia sp.]|nr:ATP-binding cassette domain-containing protein [Puia sp.]
MSTVLSLNQISKSYGKIQALNQVSFDVPAGSVFGILGPNGSGKTTLLGVVTDVLKAQKGSYQWFGNPPSAQQRKQIGTLLETPNFYHYLSAQRNLEIAAAIKGRRISDIEPVLRTVRLYDRRLSKFQTYSLGMKQRLAIASCLLGNPPVLLLDEPTNGLDPSGIAEIRELILQLAREGKTIILASHLLAEVERVCTHVAILQQGKLITSGDVRSVLSNQEWLELDAADQQKLCELMNRFPGATSTELSGGYVLVSFGKAIPNPAGINQYCFDQGLVLTHISIRKKSLESEFIALTNQVSN